ncbi:MAG: hypothetical protein GEU95_26880 [Rhizobiales bacterium]|nr:hypothetical protein [Hyphomicrobiales bacterium]
MLALTSGQQDALARRSLMRRQFIWIEARQPDGDPDPVGFWNDVGNVEHNGRLYRGSGKVVSISSMSLKGDLTIPGLLVTLSGIDTIVAAQVRGNVISQAPIEYHLGLFDVDTGQVITPLIRRFTGFVDDCVIKTPEAGGVSTIELTCESTSRALTIRRTATRSDSSHKERDGTDLFYSYTGVQRKPIYFGRKRP